MWALQIKDFFHLINMEQVLPQYSRDIYTHELQRQGDAPELAQFRLQQRIDGLLIQHATEMYFSAQRGNHDQQTTIAAT
jgi:hypothetical protein